MGEGGISTAMNRNGEKLGWTGGWIGSFIWILIFAIACFVKGYAVYGAIGVIVFSIALLMILKLFKNLLKLLNSHLYLKPNM